MPSHCRKLASPPEPPVATVPWVGICTRDPLEPLPSHDEAVLTKYRAVRVCCGSPSPRVPARFGIQEPCDTSQAGAGDRVDGHEGMLRREDQDLEALRHAHGNQARQPNRTHRDLQGWVLGQLPSVRDPRGHRNRQRDRCRLVRQPHAERRLREQHDRAMHRSALQGRPRGVAPVGDHPRAATQGPVETLRRGLAQPRPQSFVGSDRFQSELQVPSRRGQQRHHEVPARGTRAALGSGHHGSVDTGHGREMPLAPAVLLPGRPDGASCLHRSQSGGSPLPPRPLLKICGCRAEGARTAAARPTTIAAARVSRSALLTHLAAI
ncbi:MAG: hypothetical protein QOD70_1795, partial [Frankiales bacterium]|nr:hypothetical protein [Frankiales bacterium]